MNFNYIVLVAGLLLLSAVAIFNPNPFVFDEPLFPPNVELMEKYGFGRKFLVEMVDQAPGPLYEFVHLPLKGLTKLEPRGLRIVNLALFYVVIALLFLIYKRSKRAGTTSQAVYLSLHIIAITLLWQVAGLALTEIPAMVFATLTFYFGWIVLENSTKFSTSKIVLYSALTGLAGGMAVLGRTPYLVLIFAFLAVLLIQKYLLKKDVPILAAWAPYAVIALCMTVPIFVIWGGLAPPLQPRVDGAIKPWHGILSLAYTAVIGLLINPYWFVWNKRILYALITVFITFLVLNLLLESGYEYAPMSMTVANIIGIKYIMLYVKVVSPLLATAGIYFLICCFYRGKENLHDTLYIFALLSSLALLATSAKISHQFSSRYVAQAAPFLVIMFAQVKDDRDTWKWLRLIIAIAMGFLSLNTYAKVI